MLDVRNLNGRTVLVTGAASGIGRESALAFARRGAHLVICDLNAEGLEACAQAIRSLGQGRVTSHVVDVASAEQMQRFADAVHAQVPAVDLLMNNAGVGIGGGFLDTSLADWEWILGVNLRGVVHGCHFFVPAMRKRGSGHVVNVASAAGYVALESLAAYATTKFAVLGLSEALRDELGRHGIGVTCICPGIIDTPITRSSKLVGAVAAAAGARERMVDAYRRRGYGPERVAAGVLRAVQSNRAVAPITPEAWVLYYAKRFAPGLLARGNAWLARRQRRELGLPD